MLDAIFSVTPIRGKRRTAEEKSTPQGQLHVVVDETQHASVTNINRTIRWHSSVDQVHVSGDTLLADQLPYHLPGQPHVKHWYEVNHQEARSSPADRQHVPLVKNTQPQ